MPAAVQRDGGFLRHFKNKDHLVAEALTSGLDSIIEKMQAAGDSGGVNAMVSGYLSEAHRDDPSQGCPLAALGAEKPDATAAYVICGNGRFHQAHRHHSGPANQYPPGYS